jgi:hypothetical protein
MRSGKKFTINSIAACARKKGVIGRFSSQKWSKNYQKLLRNQFTSIPSSLKGQAA